MAKTTVFTCSWRRAFLLIIAIAIALGVALLFQGRMAYADDAQGSLTDEEFATQDAAEDENAAQSEANDEFAMQNEPEAQDEMDDELAVQDESDADRVRAAINALSDDPTTYTAADKNRIEAILADFESLSAEDQVAVDTGAYTGSASGQSLGRILEAALWAVWSYETDPSTTLINGTYTTETERAVSSISNKGKSDSPRVRNWWVESVEAIDGQAVANIYVTSGAATDKKLATYPSVWIAGITVDRSADNTYTIPIDLNGKTYFGGISSSMPTPIMYEL